MNEERFQQLCSAPDADLEPLLAAARAPETASLSGFEWRGYNTAPFTAALGIRKFIKGFFLADRRLEGYNIPVRQNSFEEPWTHRPHPETPRRFGFYRVCRPQPGSRDGLYPEALLLDYGASPRNPPWRPERALRDYLAQPFRDDPDILLGKAYLALGPLRVPSNFFVLARLRATSWKP